jgi:sugar phosphate permease
MFTLATFIIGFMLYGPDSLASCTGAIDVGSARGAVLAAGIVNGMGSLGPICQEKIIGFLMKRSMDTAGRINLEWIFLLLLAMAIMASFFFTLLLFRARSGKSRF